MTLAYRTFWQRKRFLEHVPHAPLVRYWPDPGLSQVEQILFEAIRSAPSVLDVGAGDLRVKRKLQTAGYLGLYETQDVGTEHPHTYADLREVTRTYDAILCLDVIEHLPLEGGLQLVSTLISKLNPGGLLVVQTPNGRCIRHPLGWDMTHVHIYNFPDLWAYLSAEGVEVSGYRVALGRRPRGAAWLRFFLGAWVITHLLGADYADNILLLARKRA